MSLEDAIRVIQIHERARQGRLRAKFMREIRQQEEREKKAALRGAPTLDPEVASVRIQKVRQPTLFSFHISIITTLHCNRVITLILAAKRNERYNEIHILNGVKRTVMDW